MSMSPTQRTLKAMREQGRIVGSVEKFNPHVGPYGIRQDLFGFIDLVAIDPERGIVAIQSCGEDFKGHTRKLVEERNEATFEWLKHADLELWGWSKKKVRLKAGGYGKGYRWTPRIADFHLSVDGELEWKERGKDAINTE